MVASVVKVYDFTYEFYITLRELEFQSIFDIYFCDQYKTEILPKNINNKYLFKGGSYEDIK